VTFFRSTKLLATAWVDRYSTVDPDLAAERIDTGHGFGRLAVDRDAVWVTNAASRTVARIERRSGEVTDLTEVRRVPEAIAVGTETTWVVCENGWLWRFRSSGEGEGVARLDDRARGLACRRASVWVLHAGGGVVEVDQATGEVKAELKVRRGGRQLLSTDDALVVLSGNGSRLCRIAPDSGEVEAETKLPERGIRGAVNGGTLWLACGRRRSPGWGALVPVDLSTLVAGAPIELPEAPRALAAGGGYLWVACGRRGRKKSGIVRVAPDSGEVAAWAKTDWTIYDLAVAGDELLATTGIVLAGPGAPLADGGAAGGGHHGGHHGGGGGGEGGGSGH
jgi:sugar lactone lactonase YvrE